MQTNPRLVRNFTIISHINHGKSTLADRFLEITETLPKEKMIEQYLDKMSLEREKGVTIKMHPCRLTYKLNNLRTYQLNLIDTPGHVDFSYEVSRALAAVEGAILLVDVTKGIQAQTIANLELAKKENLVIIPAVNKIDLATPARIGEVKEEIAKLLSLKESEVLAISAKKGIGIKDLISSIINKIPPPSGTFKKQLKVLIFDSKYDPFQGVIAYIRVFDGEIKEGDKIFLLKNKIEGKAQEVGYFLPELTSKERICAGEIGYVKTGIKDSTKVRVGDTIIKISNHKSQIPIKKIEPLPGYQEPQPVVFTSIFPKEPTTFEQFKKGLEELHLSDPSFSSEEIKRELLGPGFQCGFLGVFHLEIILERLKREFSLSLFIASPTVPFKIIDKNKKEHLIFSVEKWPDPSMIAKVKEPWIKVEILTFQKYFNNILNLFPLFKADFISSENFGREKIKIQCEMPFRRFIENFYDKLKSVSQGFASMSFKLSRWREGELVKLDILIAKEKEPTLSKIVQRSEAQKEGTKIVEKLKEIFPRQLFPVPLQAAIGGKVVARETVKTRRKDVTAPLYGGDITRKMKLLEKQKKGKKRLKEKTKVKIPIEIVLKLFKE